MRCPGGHLVATLTALMLAGVVLAMVHGQARAQDAQPKKPTEQEIFEKVFGARKKAPQVVSVPVILDGDEIGQIELKLSETGGEPRLPVAKLLVLIQKLLDDRTILVMRDTAAQDGSATPSALSKSGVKIAYDASKLQLNVAVPPELRRTVDLSMTPRRLGAFTSEPIKQADLSAYTNISTNLEYDELQGDPTNSGRQPVKTVFSNVINYEQWVFQGDAFLNEGIDGPWRRGNMVLSRDQVPESLRYSVGDLSYPTASFQSFNPLGGFSVTKRFSIQPYRVVQPAGAREFVLTSASTVEVNINGRPTQRLRLPAGKYNLRDFPGTNGVNDVRIHILDSFGREQDITFPFFFDNRLLAEGIHEFNYALGFPTTVDGQSHYKYDTTLPTFSAFHRVGVSDAFTAGVNGQANRLQQLFGSEFIYSSALGSVSLEPAFSRLDESGRYDYALNLQYQYYDAGAKEPLGQRYWTFGAVYRGGDFASLGTLKPTNTTAVDLSGRLTQPITNELTSAFSFRYQFARTPGTRDSTNQTLDLRQRIGLQGEVDLSFQRDTNTSGVTSYNAFLTLRWLFDQGQQIVTASYDANTDTQQLDYRYSPFKPVERVGAGLTFTRTPQSHEIVANGDYLGRHLHATLRHDATFPQGLNGAGRTLKTSLGLATALIFADGHFAVSQPINDSFAIVVGHRTLGDRKIGIDRRKDDYTAESDMLGPAIVPDLTPYQYRSLQVDVPDLPVGYDLGNDRPTVQPGFKSGTVVQIGTGAVIIAAGTLLGPDGKPIALVSGELRPVEIPDQKVIQFFTNRTGKFRIDGLRPGKYELVAFGAQELHIKVSLPEDATGVYSLGTLKF